MLRLAIVVVGLTGVARADTRPTDRAANAVKLSKEMALKDLCVLQRTVFDGGRSSIDLTYAVDGRVTRRERWTRESARATPELEIGETYAWTGRDLTVTIAPGIYPGVRRYRYDHAGLLVHNEVVPHKAGGILEATTVDLTWALTKLDKPVPLVRPRSTNPHALHLPYQLGFTGSATMTGTRETTITYGANGTLQPNGCKLDAQGREIACADYVKFTWNGAHLVAHWQEVHAFGPPAIIWRTQYRYDKQNRVVRAQGENGEAEGLVVAWIATLEYRCKGVEGYREP